MRVFVNIQALASLDLDQLQEAFSQNVTFDDTDPGTAALYTAGTINLAPSATSVQFPFASVTSASFLLIVASQEVLAQLDSNTAPSLPVRPTPAQLAAAVTSTYQRAAQPGLVLWRGKVTSLFLTNPSSSTPAQAFVAVVGNAT